ncbi:MAG TPA: P-II family nitrogen regulator [Nitrosopumilus sp.]|nr:P-II family nitrogen regulator [Thermoproteota archaeon]HJJ23031.1 P-II family nitrogen regulator [Nitrosopumilus sp.]
MKRVEIHTKYEFVRPILDALSAVGVGGVTVLQVRGRGKNAVPAVRGLRGTAKFVVDFNTRDLIYTIVDDSQTDAVINAVVDTVKNQDMEAFGKIFITNIEEAVDLTNGERGIKAL